jgi:hypothetical protein
MVAAPKTAASMECIFSLMLCYPLNSATPTARGINAPAARVTIKSRAPAVGRKCNRLGPVFCYQYGRFFGFVIIDQITLRKGFPGGGTVARISRDNFHHFSLYRWPRYPLGVGLLCQLCERFNKAVVIPVRVSSARSVSEGFSARFALHSVAFPLLICCFITQFVCSILHFI